MPDDYKLAALAPWLTRSEPLTRELKTAALTDVYSAVTTNVRRADAVVQTIAVLMFAVAHQATGESDERLDYAEMLRRGLETWGSTAAALESRDLTVAYSVQAVLASYVTQVWTAFETFAGDLWEAAVNTHPRILAELRSPNANVEGGGKQVPLSVLQKYDYDIGDKMGTMLRDAKKVSFDKLDGMRDAYTLAFSVDGDAIMNALADESFATAAAIRNVLVHRAGKADDDYVRKTTSLPLAPKVPLGELVPLDGELLAKLLFAAVPHAISLISAVDEWLATH